MAHDEVQESNNLSPRIKLFGATISVEERSSQLAKDNGHDHDHLQEPRKGGGNGDDRTAEKRPDKIIPCPRCKSRETKFCYFNNYNVNQPRHFCKGCHRYWTAGGALRNVPVGAGRRKNKPEGSVQQLDFDAAEHGGHLFPANRRRCASDAQTYLWYYSSLSRSDIYIYIYIAREKIN